MGTEVEHKFLVVGDSWRDSVTASTHIVQGYLARSGQVTVRARIKGMQAFLTIKGPTRGTSRAEFEYEIPSADAQEMLAELADGPVIDKVRHLVPVGGHIWEVDVFAGENAPLVLAEVELADPDEPFEIPAWAGADVSHDARYFNANLALEPYSRWGAAG
jgi:adenylate cyclase